MEEPSVLVNGVIVLEPVGKDVKGSADVFHLFPRRSHPLAQQGVVNSVPNVDEVSVLVYQPASKVNRQVHGRVTVPSDPSEGRPRYLLDQFAFGVEDCHRGSDMVGADVVPAIYKNKIS